MGIYNIDLQGKKYSFDNRADCAKFTENMLRVESRREAAGNYVTPEMQIPRETQDHLYWKEQLTLNQENNTLEGRGS